MDILDTDAFDRRQRRNVSCALFFSLLPFFTASALYFYLWTPDSPASVTIAGIKSAPTLLLAATVLLWNGGRSVLGVGGGLILSAVGDICLVWSELFVHGMGAFALAHLLYSITFLSSRYTSPSPSSSWTRLLFPILILSGAGFYVYLYPFLQQDPHADLLTPGVAVYILLITLMGALAFRSGQWLTLLGSLVFMVSDLSLALQVFKVMKVDNGNYVVMVTYYLAQMLIAVGDMRAEENQDEFAKWKRS